MPTFLPVYPLVHLARGRRAIFDFGCGLGQSSFLLDRVAPDADIVCGDYSFTAMYLAKRYFVPQATCICLDGDYPLPFVNGCFDHVFSTDALQYIGPKVGLAREFQRILTADGTIALAHLHNRLSPERGCTGTGLTPPGYRGLFDGMVRRLFPEAAIVADYVADGALNLEREYDVEDPGQWMSGVSLVAAASSDQLRNLSGLLEDAVARAREPRVNPLYAATRSGQGWLLERRVGEPYAFERTISGYELLPKRILLETPSLDSAALLALRDRVGGGDLRDLMRRFVVLDLPSRFLPPGTGA
jgi:SAM-dependent methyltransferase